MFKAIWLSLLVVILILVTVLCELKYQLQFAMLLNKAKGTGRVQLAFFKFPKGGSLFDREREREKKALFQQVQ